MMANRKQGAIYTGVTSALQHRVWQHREGTLDGFSKQYDSKKLIWFELHGTMEQAILREKQIKAGSRRKKITLIEADNPNWRDLYFALIDSEMDCRAAAPLAMTQKQTA